MIRKYGIYSGVDTSDAAQVPADKENLSSRMRELLLRATVEERRKQESENPDGERRRRSDQTSDRTARD
jgi:hypothetical protein